MFNPKSLISAATTSLCIIFAVCNSTFAQEQFSSTLPEGHYVYLGPIPGKLPQRPFTIDSTGAVHWDSVPESVVKADEPPSKPGENSDLNWESREYPVIKWKPVLVEGSFKAAARLTTTFEYGMVKYQILLGNQKGSFLRGGAEGLYKSAAAQGLAVELLDKNGFKLGEFRIPGNALHLIENRVQGRGTAVVLEELYSRAYGVNIR